MTRRLSDPKRRATIYDVARAADVSHQTVARFLRGERVREETRERVEAALAELKYQPNQSAKALATNRSFRIGAFVHMQAQWALQAIMDGAAEEARKAGYVLDLVAVDPHDPESVSEALKIMAQSSLAGVIVLAAADAMLKAIDANQVSVPVIVERSARKHKGRYSEPDFALGVEHLVELGHRRFFHVSGPLDWPASRARRKAFHGVVRDHDGVVVGDVEGDWSAESGFRAMAEHFDREAGATAVVCANDHMALGVLNWLAGEGITVPDEVSVLGFDGLPDGAFYLPPLTTVAVDDRAFGRNLMRRLLRQMGVKSQAVPTRAQLVVRGSTAPPGQA